MNTTKMMLSDDTVVSFSNIEVISVFNQETARVEQILPREINLKQHWLVLGGNVARPVVAALFSRKCLSYE